MEQQPSQGDKRQERKGAEEGGTSRVQRFHFGPWVFNVNRAQALIAETPREAVPLPVALWARSYGLDDAQGPGFSLIGPGPGFDRDYAMTTDLEEPVLIATLRNNEGEEFSLLIDGTHRLYHAYTERMAELPAYVLTAEETLAIREEGYLRGGPGGTRRS